MLCVYHIYKNKLNNIDSNLRLTISQVNYFNKSAKSNIKGVRNISENNYSATITKDGKNISSEKQATEMYNLMTE